jgi:ATP-dependent RNA helicase DeaD
MPGTFEELGIAPGLVSAAGSIGWEAPGALQQAAIPVIRRGNNAVLHAASGSGAGGAYGLAIMDRLVAASRDEAPRALILVATPDLASRTADSLARLAVPAGLTVSALAPGWPHRPADLLVASAAGAVAAIRDSSLKIGALDALVIDGADQLAATDQWEALETILEAAPTEAQRILVTARFDRQIDGLIERHVRKAMTIPPRPAEETAPATTGGAVRYMLAPEREKTAAAMAALPVPGETDVAEIALVCRTPARAEGLSAELAARGVPVHDGADDGAASPRVIVLSRLQADRRSTKATVISFDVPLDADSLLELHPRGGTIVVTPGELTHLRLIARRAGVALEAATPPRAAVPDRVTAVRDRLRATVQSADLAADLALIEPLLDEFPAAELAAAALHLARAAVAAERDAPAEPGRRAARAADSGRGAPAAPAPTTAWVRLFITAGTRDGLGPGDLVGAITGETGLAGEEVGKIEIRESHSTVEVPSGAAESVINALNGRSLRGRSLRVDYDRKERTQRPPSGRDTPRSGGARPGGSRPGGSRPGGSRPGGSRPGGSRPGGPRPGGSRPPGRGPRPRD